MNCQIKPEELSAWSTFGSLIVSVLVLIFASKVYEQLKHSSHASLLAIEDSLALARQAWMDSIANADEARELMEAHETPSSAARYRRCVAIRDSAYEQYLNRVDRLCAAVKDKMLDERRIRDDYQGLIESLVERDPILAHRTKTQHSNISYYYNRWKVAKR